MIIQASETKEKVDALKSDNKELEDKITALGQVFQKWYPPYKQTQLNDSRRWNSWKTSLSPTQATLLMGQLHRLQPPPQQLYQVAQYVEIQGIFVKCSLTNIIHQQQLQFPFLVFVLHQYCKTTTAMIPPAKPSLSPSGVLVIPPPAIDSPWKPCKIWCFELPFTNLILQEGYLLRHQHQGLKGRWKKSSPTISSPTYLRNLILRRTCQVETFPQNSNFPSNCEESLNALLLICWPRAWNSVVQDLHQMQPKKDQYSKSVGSIILASLLAEKLHLECPTRQA